MSERNREINGNRHEINHMTKIRCGKRSIQSDDIQLVIPVLEVWLMKNEIGHQCCMSISGYQ
jgi:hypothetical protein